MKVIILGPAWPYRGGIAAFNERLARQYQAEGHDVEVVTFTLQYPSFLFPGTTQYSTDPAPEGLKITRKLSSINPFSWIATGRYIKKQKPDLIVSAYWLPFMAPAMGTTLRCAKHKGTRRIAILHNLIPHEHRPGDKMFSKYFGNTPRKIESIPVVNKVPGEVKRGEIREELSQSKLVMGLRSAYFEEDEDCLANSLMCIVLGGTPTSKLFLNVREKESLCYYCASRMDNNKGIMLIDSGVEAENIEKTEESILRQLDLMQKGEVTEEELDGAKLALKNALMSSLDSLAALQGYYIGGILRKGQLSPEKAASVVDKISRERVIELANCLRLDTVFALRGEK